jgi:4-hydroxyphenylpyruvate dioxygenase-like putative hemolysin
MVKFISECREEDLEYKGLICNDDIIKTVSQLKARGVEFSAPPHTYYQAIRNDWEMQMMKKI